MTKNRLLRALLLCPLFMLFMGTAWAQNKTVTGKVTDEKGNPVSGASVTVKGSKSGTTTNASGAFTLSVPSTATTLVISYIGYSMQEVAIGSGEVSVSLKPDASSLTEVVAVGYSTARKKDLTGSVVSVKAKDFNQGIQVAPDQLIQGKVAGIQVVNNSGQPGGATSVRIRGTSSIRTGNQPLYVLDGVPLDGRSARPGLAAQSIGTTPDANPLNFINASDIASIDVLKDASATAIYGSRGANGVIMITTKKGQSGKTKIDVVNSVGISNILRTIDVMDAGQYRTALAAYGQQANDKGSNTDAVDAITQTGITNNHAISISGGSENARIRTSLSYFNTQGIIKKTELKRYTAFINGNFKFLESKRLGLDLSLFATNLSEQVAPVSTDAGFVGSLVGMALQWNPTRSLYNEDGSLQIDNGGDQVNPLAMSAAYDDKVRTNNVLAAIQPYFKITNDLEYRMILSLNYSSGIRRSQISRDINLAGVQGIGWAAYGNSELFTQQATHLLNYKKEISSDLFIDVLAGYEYMRFKNQGIGLNAFGFTSDALPYTDYFQGSNASNRGLFSFNDPSSELQSFFGRATVNLQNKYLITATMRADGSSKFGKNNRYGYFPAVAAAWNISNEEFMKGNSVFDNLKLRLGWGITGNQEFPAGAAQEQFAYTGPNSIEQINVANPDLKWETSTQTNAGIDFSILKNRIYGSIDYFYKNTTNILFNFDAIQPAPAAKYWINLDGNLVNSGAEITLAGDVVKTRDFQFTLGTNVAFLKNELKNYTGPDILTGAINGQGLTGAYSQKLANGQPVNAFYMGTYTGLVKNETSGLYEYTYEGGDPNNNANRSFVGSPNPKTLLGVNATFNYKKITLVANMFGAFGFKIYNNTRQATLAIGNVGSNRNIAVSEFDANNLIDRSQSQPVSTRFLEDGGYMKMANMTLSYNIGDIGTAIKSANIYITGQNLFLITNYSGFDPEVNTPKPLNGVPSFGIEYTPYPSARSFTAGISFSL